MKGRRNAPLRVRDDVDGVCELVHIFTLTPRGEHVVGEMINIVTHPVVWIEEGLDTTPPALDGVRMSPTTLINETDGMVDNMVRVQIPVRRTAVTDNRSAGFDPVTSNSHQRVGGPVRNRNEKRFAGLVLDTARDALLLHSMAPIVLRLTELAFTDFDSLVRTANFLRAA
jgi:hypothetical protein